MVARDILLKQLHRLMASRGWQNADGTWNISELHGKVRGSKARLYKVVYGKANFTIDYYEKLLTALNVTFDGVVSMISPTETRRAQEVEDLHGDLDIAIENATQTRTIPSLKYTLSALVQKSVSDKAEFDRLRKIKIRDGPSPAQREGKEPVVAGKSAGGHRKQR